MAISRIQWQSSSRIRRSNGRSLEIHHESRTFSFCPRAAGLPKERFQTPPKNKLVLPVGSRALSHRFCTHRTPEREERGSSKFLLLLFYSSFFSLSFIFSLVISRVSRTSIFERNRDSRFSTSDGPNTLHPAVLTKIESSLSRLTHRVPLLRSTATKLGRLAEVTRGCTVYGRIYPG